MKYYIYHIEGKKIGCSTQPKRRVQMQGYSEWTILEEHSDIYIASDREIELQKQYGYLIDTIPYWKAYEMRTKNSDLNGSIRGGQTQGRINDISGHLAKVRIPSNGGKASSNIKKQCPHCNYIGKMPSIFRNHFDRCKSKPY